MGISEAHIPAMTVEVFCLEDQAAVLSPATTRPGLRVRAQDTAAVSGYHNLSQECLDSPLHLSYGVIAHFSNSVLHPLDRRSSHRLPIICDLVCLP